MSELKNCPFCNKPVSIGTPYGTCIEINCCVNMVLQKSDVLTIEERETWNPKTYLFSPEVEAKALAAITQMWNTRYVA